ncbi:hypothetical protein V6N13_079977 [Hibiscus sabdariffa]|uniref:EF-hand domain-containing protein n=2 Tax=Hibiscus sabdariffa TaxID=183260 RepID=A0ABR2RT02_9ROSI
MKQQSQWKLWTLMTMDCFDLEDIIKLMEDKLRDLKEALEMYDEDGCGFIAPKGLKKMLKKLGESKSIDEYQKKEEGDLLFAVRKGFESHERSGLLQDFEF